MEKIEFCTLPQLCPYLKDRNSKSWFIYFKNISFNEHSKLIENGFRRFGKYYSKPICDGCKECKTIRYETNQFVFKKSFKRVINKNSKIKTFIGSPILDKQRLKLYDKYHNFMQDKKGWDFKEEINYETYYHLFIDGAFPFAKEISYYYDDKLICVDLIDLLRDGISSIYCYYDPDFMHLSLGKYSFLMQFMLAQKNSIPYIYPGYYVKDCASLSYKAEYKPYKILQDNLNYEEA